MATQVQTSYEPQSYTESVPVTTYCQVVEERGGYHTQAIPLVSIVPACGAGSGSAGCSGGLFSKHTGGCGGGHLFCGGGHSRRAAAIRHPLRTHASRFMFPAQL